MDIDISFIIPVYNSEDFIVKTLDSIVNLKLVRLEIIVINDGSTDKSGQVCNEYAKNYNYIRIIHIENSGVSNARNIGINESRGRYIQFVDSDDWLDSEYLQELRRSIDEECDLVSFNFIYEKDNKSIRGGEISNDVKFKNTQKSRVIDQLNPNYVWDKIFLASIIRSNNIKFNEQVSYGEDSIFLCEFLKFAHSFKFIKKPLYHYRLHRECSLSNSKYHPDMNEYVKNLYYVQADLGEDYIYEYYNRKFFKERRLLSGLYNIFNGNFNNEERREQLKNFIFLFKREIEEFPYKSPTSKVQVFILKSRSIFLIDFYQRIKSIMYQNS